MRRIVAIALAALVAVGCSKEESSDKSVLPQEPCPAVVEAPARIRALEHCTDVDQSGDKLVVTSGSVRGMTADAFRRQLEEFPGREVHVWMPGERDWVLVGHAGTNRVSLAKVMNEFAADTNCTMSVAEVFASYVGTREEVLPAFERKLEGEVVPEWFVTKEIPEIKWLDTSDIDEDILTATMSEIRSMQVVRRLLLEGNMLAAKAKDKKGEEEAIDRWARAALRNPFDPMLRERIENLKRNAKGFLALNKVLQALKCYETIVLITPNDAAAVYNFGACLMKIGKRDMAEEVMKRGKELLKRQEALSTGP